MPLTMHTTTQGPIGLAVLISLAISAVSVATRLPVESRPSDVRGAWYHSEAHPVHDLFKRDVVTPGSQQWGDQYPRVTSPPIPEALTPQSWLNALRAAEDAGQIPNITQTTQSRPNSNPLYSAGESSTDPSICSSTAQCKGPDDQWDAPDGHLGIGFDDGPSAGSAKLYEFLQAQNQSATHFMIGINILNNYQLFNWAFSTLQNDIAVHTWTHPYMTSQNNTQVVAQLGWTLQIIHDSTGGRVPRYWRPPYGDSDNRVRAIAKTVFGLTQIDWNRDTNDWSLATGGTTYPQVEGSLRKWYTGPKSPGLIILEHELDNNTSGAFIETYSEIKANNWTAVSTAKLFSGAYQNAADNVGEVHSMDVAGPTPATTSNAPVMPTTSSASSSALAPDNKHINKTSSAIRLYRIAASLPLLLLGVIFSATLWMT